MSQHTPTLITPCKELVSEARIAIVTAKWNDHITSLLRQGAIDQLLEIGVRQANIGIFEVPGAVELTFAASHIIENADYDAIIVFGCVVRGNTPHFDYVCQSVTQGVTALNADCDTPVIFGLLTVDNEQQAIDRCGGPAGHKGREAALTAMDMLRFIASVD